MSKFKAAPKWKKEPLERTITGASIRAKGISGPIPLPDDDEFPIRTPGTGIATPLGEDGVEKQLFRRESVVDRPDSTVLVPGNTATIDFGGQTIEEGDTPNIRPPVRESSPPQDRRSVAQASLSSKPASSVGKPQRKKSSLKVVLGRLFGRKQKASPSTNPIVRAEQHRSDPSALNRSPKENAVSQQRSTSLPVNEFSRALRSHSVAIDNLPSLGENNDGRESSLSQSRPRRSSTSRMWTPNKIPGLGDWTGLSPRPASSHARDSRFIGDHDDEENIGVAVTCHPNRRSRSVGELRGSTPAKVLSRRRSDEIRYWRESYDPGLMSPMSSNKAENEEQFMMNEREQTPEGEPERPTQPFNFGVMGEMAGMKITQAASLESRVLRLEKKIYEMERTVSQVLARSSIVLQAPPSRISKRGRSDSANRPKTGDSDMSLPTHQVHRGAVQQGHSSNSGSQFRSSSYGSTRPSTTSTNNSYLTFEHASSREQIEHVSQQTARPLSTSTTIRGIPSSSPTHAKDGALTSEQYTALANMVIAEQTARQNLEAIVQGLQQQLHTVLMRSSKPISYPTPISGGAGVFSSFETDDSEDEEGQF